MFASRLLVRASRPNAIAIAIGLRQNAAVKVSSVRAPASARLFSSIQSSSAQRPSIRPSSVLRQSSIASLTSARFKSTTAPATTATAADATPTTTTPATPNPEFEPFDSFSSLDLNSLTDVQKNIPEHIGFLKELGLDFGWGPTAFMQWFIEHIHIYAGTPWWASIIVATALIRFVQLPGYLRLSDVGARMREVQPFAQPTIDKLLKARQARDLVTMHVAKKELNDIYKKAEINRMWLLWPFAQLPVFYGFYTLMRAMAEVPVPGLLEGGTLWFGNLTIADPFVVFPLVSAGSLAMGFLLGGDTGNTNISPAIRKGLMIVAPTVSVLFMWSWPAAMTLCFATSAVIGLAQNFALRSPAIRKFFGLYPIVHKPAPAPATSMKITDVSATTAGPVDARTKLAEKVKSMMGVQDAPPMVKNFSNWVSDGAGDRKHRSYDRKRDEEEAARRKAVIEGKRRRAMKDEL